MLSGHPEINLMHLFVRPVFGLPNGLANILVGDFRIDDFTFEHAV